MRKSERVSVPATWGERDAEKVFVLTEMSALKAEKWLYRLMSAFNSSNASLPGNVAGIGWEGLAVFGINAFFQSNVSFEKVEPLLDELMDCVAIIRDRRGAPDVATKLVSADIEEVKTVMWLRSEVIKLHTGFSLADALSELISRAATSANAPSPASASR
jgi:hypothetical protein